MPRDTQHPPPPAPKDVWLCRSYKSRPWPGLLSKKVMVDWVKFETIRPHPFWRKYSPCLTILVHFFEISLRHESGVFFCKYVTMFSRWQTKHKINMNRTSPLYHRSTFPQRYCQSDGFFWICSTFSCICAKSEY